MGENETTMASIVVSRSEQAIPQTIQLEAANGD